jgi:5-methylcytosine-specific restriction protein A
MNIELFERKLTDQEASKRHITIIKKFQKQFLQNLGKVPVENMALNNRKSQTKLGLFRFIEKKSKKPVDIKIVRRSPTGRKKRNEMRLYITKELGYPQENDILKVIFRKKYKPLIWMELKKNKKSQKELKKILKSKYKLSDNGANINQALYEPQKTSVRYGSKMKRSRKLAFECIETAKNKCEAGYTKPRFISQHTKRIYLEAHHLIPNLEKFGRIFQQSPDQLENLYALSPHAHRALHLGTYFERRKIINKLLKRRNEVLKRYRIDKETIYKIYDI